MSDTSARRCTEPVEVSLSLKTQTLILVVLLVLLSTGPLVWYYLQTTASLTALGTDPQIERALAAAIRSADSPEQQAEAAGALRNYGQISVLKGRIVRQVLTFSVFYSAGVVIVSLVAGFYFVSRITRPLKRLTEATRGIGEGTRAMPLEPGQASGEVAQLVAAFNGMIRNLDAARQQLAIAERRATWQHVARTIAHEIKNPLTPIKLSTERMYDKYLNRSADFPEVIKSTTATVLAEIGNLQKLVDTFHRYAKFPDPVLKPEAVNDVIEEVVTLQGTGRVPVGRELDPASPVLPLDRGQLREGLCNLVRNAIEAVETRGAADGRVTVKSRVVGRAVEIIVEDNGCGIAPEDRKRLFHPYFTTKKHGNGIGLALTERIVTLNGGTIAVESEEGKGTTFTMRFATGAGEGCAGDGGG